MGEDITIQGLALVGAVIGGAFAIINALIRLIERLITNRNGNNRVIFSESDKQALHNLTAIAAQISSVKDYFAQSHSNLRDDMRSLIRSQTEMINMFTKFLEKFSQHMEQFKCLRISSEGTD